MLIDIFLLFLAMLLTKFKESKGFQILNVIQNGPDSISFDATIDAIHMKNPWSIGDEAHLMLPQTSGETATVVGKVTYVKNYQSFPTDTENIYIYGTVPPVEHISLVSGTFSMAFYNNTITANIQYPGDTQYELRPLRYERNDSDLTKSPNYILSKINMFEKYYSKQIKETEARKRVIQSQSQHYTQPIKLKNIELQETAYLKVLMMYTKEAATAAGGENNLLSAISLAIGNFNIALQNSNVDISVNYAAQPIVEYNTYVESDDFEIILSQMGSNISTSQRKALSCHAVHLVVSQTAFCGIGYYLFNGMTNGYSVGSYSCIANYATTAHEVGHNIGLAHDLSVVSPENNYLNLPNHGYCWDDPGSANCYRTIMAYASCVTPLGRTNCDRVLIFSNPDLIYKSAPIGTVSQCNNAQQLRNNINNFMGQFSLFPSNTPTKIPIAPTFSPISLGKLDNLGFENGLVDWVSTGTTSVVTTVSRTGNGCAMIGAISATNGDSSISLSFIAANRQYRLSFWYKMTCQATVTTDWATATLIDNTLGTVSTILAKVCVTSTVWTQVSVFLIYGHTYTLTLINHDDYNNSNNSLYASHTLYDDITFIYLPSSSPTTIPFSLLSTSPVNSPAPASFQVTIILNNVNAVDLKTSNGIQSIKQAILLSIIEGNLLKSNDINVISITQISNQVQNINLLTVSQIQIIYEIYIIASAETSLSNTYEILTKQLSDSQAFVISLINSASLNSINGISAISTSVPPVISSLKTLPPTSSPLLASNSNSDSNLGGISLTVIGGIVGGVIILILICICIFFCHSKKGNQISLN